MKRTIKYSLMLIIGLGSLQTCWATKKCNDLILILDPRQKEKTDGEHLAMASDFLRALQEKAAPIIISSNVVENFCFWKNEFKQTLDDIKQEALSTKDFNATVEKSQTLLDQQPNKLEPFFAAELSLTDLTDNDWYCYAHKKANLMLLIPKNYVANRAQKSITDNNAQIKECGFNITNLDKISNVSPEALLKYLETKHTQKPEDLVEALQSMFITKKSNPQTDNGSWNIYLTGHGDPALQKNGVLAPETAYIAGISFNDFVRLMKFFNNDITTLFIHYITCFGGGYNQTTVNAVLSALNANFIITAEGINEAFTSGGLLDLKINDKGTNFVVSNLRFTNFFGMLENFFGDPAAFIKTKAQQDDLQKDPIGAILRNLIDVSTLQTNQPFVRIPAVGVFNALSIDKSVKILTNAIAKAHELEGRLIDLGDPEIKTIIMYPTHIGVPLRLNGTSAIVSPTIVAKNGQATHIFKEIIDNTTFNWTIYNFILLNSSYSKITFIIKKLETFNYENSGLDDDNYDEPISIDNMTIQITGKLSPDKAQPGESAIDSTINITFTFNEKNYTVSEHIENLAGNTDEVFNLFETLQVSPATGTTAIVTEKMDKSSRVKKPGALKKVLLLQQLSALELATEPEQLKKDEIWREQNKETALAKGMYKYVSPLNALRRHSRGLQALKRQIDRLSNDQINYQERAATNIRISKLQVKIDNAMQK